MQKPVEWNKEDKTTIEDACSVLEFYGNIRLASSLKSLCPQPHWESSEKDKEMKLKILKYLSTRCSVEQFEEVEEWLNDKLK